MSKQAIQRIIIFMSIALLGIVSVQTYSIVQSIRLNGEQFDSNVRAALDHVVTRLEQAEIARTANQYDLPKITSNSEQVTIEEISSALRSGDQSEPRYSSAQHLLTDSNWMYSGAVFTHEKRTRKKGCNKEVFLSHFTTYFNHHSIVQDYPIVKRIDPKMLDELLLEELQQKGISIPYNYGLYSHRCDSFVMTVGQYPKGKQPDVQQASVLGLEDAKYQVKLFPSANHALGELMVHFPDRSGYVWSSVWLNLLGSILFTGIIIFGFYYTIQVILRQKQLSEMKSDFLSNMTHEFKTPIATISLATDAIGNASVIGNPDKLKRFINIIQQENRRMNGQVEKVLQMAQIDRREFQLKIKTIDAHALIAQAADNSSLQIEKRDGELIQDLQAENSYIQADETHFSNIINNLLDNANKYSPDRPEIRIQTRNVANGLELRVSDKGLGISKEARKNIFDKFYRVPTGNLHDIKGFGLGLSYVKAMMTAHGGHVDVKSEPGKGSTFILFFPFKQEEL